MAAHIEIQLSQSLQWLVELSKHEAIAATQTNDSII